MPHVRFAGAAILAAALAVAAPAASQQTSSGRLTGFAAPESFAPLVKAKLPAVVNVSTTQKVKAPEGFGVPPVPPGSPLEDFFEEFMGRMFRDAPPRELTALGSGFIIDPAGYVVTNNHVVAEAEDIKVILQDDTELHAQVVGRDPRTDLALLKVDGGRPLPAVEWGDSDAVQVGDWVVAIGNPFGLGGTVTSGIISARARDIQVGPYDDFLQTDAAINRGNSGGPMFDMTGGVVGVATAIFSPTGGSIGIGFAVPSAIAKEVVAQLREHGQVRRGWLGVTIQRVTEDLAAGLGLDRPRGALVAQVAEDSPAARAGLRPGDVIVRYAGKPVDEARQLPRLVGDTPVNERVPIVVWRDGRERQLEVQIALLREEPDDQRAASRSREPSDRTDRLGLALAPITPEMRERFDLDEETKGALVVAVRPDSPAAESGLAPGDVIVQAGGEDVERPADVAEAAEKARAENKRSLLVLREREGTRGFVAIPLQRQG